MDEFKCSWCSRRFHLEGKPDNEYSESFLDELEKLAGKLDVATRNQDYTSDGFCHSSPKTQAHNIQLNISLENDRNFSTNSFLRDEQVTSPVSPFITQCYGSSLDVSRSDSHVFAQQIIFEASKENHENTLVVPDEASQGVFCLADDNQSNPSEDFSSMKHPGCSNLRPVPQRKHKNTIFGDDGNTCKKKENKPSAFNRRPKRAYLDVISASPMYIETDGNNSEGQKGEDYSENKTIFATVTQMDDCSTREISINSVELGSVAVAEAVSVAGPSGIRTESHRTGKERRFVCNVCGKGFCQKSNLDAHHRTHTREKLFVCRMCDKRFTQQSHLTTHLRTHTGEKPFACNRCDKKFGRKAHLDDHLRTHTGEKPFACHKCKKKFAQKTTLEIHLRTHTGEKPFACNRCDKKFGRKAHLDDHLRTHTGEKPFACHKCKKKFANKTTLEIHLRTHTGEKPFACNRCDKKFGRKAHLDDHLRTHTGEKPFACHKCKKEFAQKITLERHLRTHTGEKPCKCQLCGKTFANQSECHEHCEREHGGK